MNDFIKNFTNIFKKGESVALFPKQAQKKQELKAKEQTQSVEKNLGVYSNLNINEINNSAWRSDRLGSVSSFIDTETSMAYYSNLIFIILDKIKKAVSRVPLKVYEQLGDEVKEIVSPDVDNLLNHPTEKTQLTDFMCQIVLHYFLTGNTFIYLGDIKENEAPKYLIPLNPSKISIRYKKEVNSLEEYYGTELVDHYIVNLDGQQKIIYPYQIWCFKDMDPQQPFVGTSAVKLITPILDILNNAIFFTKRKLENGAFIGGFIESAFRDEETLQALQDSFTQKYSGSNNAGKILTMPKGNKFIPASENNRDLEFINLFKEMEDLICAAFGVSNTILGKAEQNTNRATADTAVYVFMTNTIVPFLTKFVESFNTFIMPRFETKENVFLGFEDETKENKEYTRDTASLLFDKKIITKNEARGMLKFDPVDGGDEFEEELDITDIDPNNGKDKLFKSKQKLKSLRREKIVGKFIKKKESQFKAKVEKMLSTEDFKSLIINKYDQR